MGKKEKLRNRFISFPKEFTFNELEQLLTGFGYKKVNKGHTSGSRVIFKKSDKRPIMLHKPHPVNIVKQYALRQVYEELKNAGLID